MFTVLVVQYAGTACGYWISTLFKKSETAVLFVPVFMMPAMLLGGFFLNVGTGMEWIIWLQYLSPVRYGTEALLQNEFSSRENFPDAINPLVLFGLSLGYWLSMVLLVTLGTTLMFFSLFNLKFFVTRPQ